jgi:hypothetical protein
VVCYQECFLGQRLMMRAFAKQTGAAGALVVLVLFALNELSVAILGPTMFYVAGRVAVIPCAGLLVIGLSGLQLVRRKEHGARLLVGLATTLCVVAVILFQFVASYPVAKYLGLWSG